MAVWRWDADMTSMSKGLTRGVCECNGWFGSRSAEGKDHTAWATASPLFRWHRREDIVAKGYRRVGDFQF